MRESKRDLLPALKHTGRPNNSVASHRRRKRANAQTHGAYAEPLILPGEDPREFEALHAALIEEWKPSVQASRVGSSVLQMRSGASFARADLRRKGD